MPKSTQTTDTPRAAFGIGYVLCAALGAQLFILIIS